MTTIINFPSTTYTNEAANARLRELGATFLIKEDENRVQVIRDAVLLGKNNRWGTETPTTLTITGTLPKGVRVDLDSLVKRGVITSYR